MQWLKSFCISLFTLVQDCRLSDACDPNARCVDTGKVVGKKYGGTGYRCHCKAGYVGNGITCAHVASG